MSKFTDDWKENWLILIDNCGYCENAVYRFFGSEKEAREKLLDLVQNDKEADLDHWWYGTEFAEDVENAGSWELHAAGYYTYDDKKYQIKYSAIKFSHIDNI